MSGPRGLRIGIDARELGGRPTGVGRYLSEILEAWRALPEARRHEFVLFRPNEPGSAWTGVSREPDALRLVERRVGRHRGSLWEQTSLPMAIRADRVDVLFAPAYTCPLATGVPVALTIHDLSFLAHSEWFRPRERVKRAWLTKRSARRAGIVLTDSAFSAQEIQVRLGVSATRIRVIPLGVRRREVASDAAGPTDDTRRVLFVGSIFNRRHVPDLINAFAIVAESRPEARLDIVGENRTWPQQDLTAVAQASGVADRVSIRSYVPEAGLDALYRGAKVFAFLSEYEGFGLTPLEALGYGVPIVVLDTPIAREIYGPAAAYVSLGDVSATAATLANLLDDIDARRAALSDAPAVLAKYRWDRAAAQTLDAIVSAAGGDDCA